MRLLFLLLVMSAIISSCVTNRQVQYLQNEDVNVKSDLFVKDSILRTYALGDFEYRLQPEDIIRVDITSLTNEDLDFFSKKSSESGGGNLNSAGGILLTGYLIDENGQIHFPVIEPIKVAGLTIFEARDLIRKIANNYVEEPIVEVRLLNFRFTMLGEVKSEGVITNFNNRIHILEAIGLSGGFTDFADKSNVKIIRQNAGKADVYYLDLLSEDLISSEHFYVNQQDVIIVPPLRQRPYQVYFGKNLSVVISSISLMLIVLGLIRPN